MRVLAATVLVLIVSIVTSALPTSLVADAQVAATKAKRVDEEMMFGNQQNKPSASGIFYSSVSKRAVQQEEAVPAVFLPTDAPAPSDAEDKEASRRVISHTLSDDDLLAHMRRGAMDSDENSKTVRQYEKGYLYGVGKEALDKKAENTLLKSEVYGEPVNEYRYYGGGDTHRDVERVAPKKHSIYSAADVGARLKRDLEVDPEALLALISLWQSQRAPAYPSYRDRADFPRYGFERQVEENEGNEDEEVDNGDWLDSPVPLSHYQYDTTPQYPLGNHYGMVDNYPNVKSMYYPPLTRVEHKRGQWGGFNGYAPEKRFMVSKRRQFQPDRFEEPSVWSRLLASQPRDPMPGMTPRRRILL